ncbi:hypothetical protein ACFYRC_05955 [Streptomyces sp. NPDC005279]|uniref:hypothetical protein n=1 Tax=Streptomyces sp. NPDC005279 TaxID=3364712 RepID=UPI0036B4D1EB
MMGYELYRDVKEWAPPGLTHREKLTAMVLADDANDRTRLTYRSVVDPEIMRQALVKNDRDMRKVVAKLLDHKVMEHAGGGHNGKAAKFRFLHLSPDGCPGAPACNCPLTKPVQIEPATHDVAGPEGTGYNTATHGGPVQKEPATQPVGGSNRHGSRSNSNLPTPSSPSNDSSSPRARAELIVQRFGATEDETKTLLDKIEATRRIDNLPAYVSTLASRGDLEAQLVDLRGRRDQSAAAYLKARDGGGGPHPFQDDGAGLSCAVCSLSPTHARHRGAS